MLAHSLWGNSAIAWPALRNASRLSKAGPETPGADLARRLSSLLTEAGLDPENPDRGEIAGALLREGHRRLGEFLDGTLAYRRHAYRRSPPERSVIWGDGTTKLRDYRASGSPGIPPSAARLLVIPSLVNRYYILDLLEDQSFLQDMARRGFAPFVIDWGAPGELEKSFTLEDYIARRLEGALGAVEREGSGPIVAIGYCMGGMLALALALRAQGRLAGLACLATPWDFHAGEAAQQARLIGAIGAKLEPLIAVLGEFPVDLLQSLFALLDPVALLNKFRRFEEMDHASEHARRFVALEDWLNDGTGLAAPVARECLTEWYGANAPARNAWRVGGSAVDPHRLRLPSISIVPSNDRIVPPESALALARALQGGETLVPKAGHIGMMVGGSARSQVWDPLARWIETLVPARRETR